MMIPPKEFIAELTRVQRKYPCLRRSYKRIKPSDIFVLEGESHAINNGIEIPVSGLIDNVWFAIIWSWVELEGDRSSNVQYGMNLSIPFFVGKADNTKKQSIFRAEWDNYKQDSGVEHSQPHWHFTQVQGFVEELDSMCYNFDDESINLFWNDEAKNILSKYPPIENMHFALSEHWIEDGDTVKKIESVEDIVKWISSLLLHVKAELQYAQ